MWWWVVRSMMPSVTGTQTWRVRRHARLECRLPCPLAAACWETATGAQPPFGVRATEGDAPQREINRKGATSRGENESLGLCIVFLSASPPCSSSGVCCEIRYPFTSSTRRTTPDWKSRVRGEKTWGHSFEPAMQRFLSRLLPAGAISPLAQVT